MLQSGRELQHRLEERGIVSPPFYGSLAGQRESRAVGGDRRVGGGRMREAGSGRHGYSLLAATMSRIARRDSERGQARD